MTLVLGVRDYNYAILAADREQSGWLKTDVCKIAARNCKNGWNVAFAGAGHGNLIDYAAQAMGIAIDNKRVTTKDEVKAKIETVLEQVYTKQILPTKDIDKYGIEFNVLAQKKNELALFTTDLSAVREVETPRDYALIGCGHSFAHYLLNKYFGVLSLPGAVVLSLYVVRQTKKYIQDVGGGTDMLIATTKGKFVPLAPSLLLAIEAMLDELDEKLDMVGFCSMYIDDAWEGGIDQLKREGGKIRKRMLDEINRLFVAYGLE
jgi:hypothetical protein